MLQIPFGKPGALALVWCGPRPTDYGPTDRAILDVRNGATHAMNDEALEKEGRYATDLVARLLAGDSKAEADLVQRYRDGLVLVLRRRVGNHYDAEDLAHEALLLAIDKLKRKRETLVAPERLAGYLRGIAMNLSIGEVRKAERRRTEPDSELIERVHDGGARDPVASLSRSEVRRIVRKLLDELTVERDREVLIRLFVLEEDREEVCRALELEATHLNRVLHRAKQRFKELVERAERSQNLSLVE